MRGVVLLLLVASTVPLSGCLACQPHLDVRNCLPGVANCTPRPGDPVVEADDPVRGADAFPDIRDLMAATPVGEHNHAEWNATLEEAFWAAHGIPVDQPEKQVFYRDGDRLFRVRVLACG